MAGYALSRPQLRYGKLLTALFIIPIFVGGGLIPTYLNIRNLGLLNTFWALVLPTAVSPFYLLIVRSHFVDYPQELVEAATIDGARPFGVFWRVVWPTSTPIIATMAMLYGVAQWNEYFWPSILVQQNLQPASVLLQNMVTNRSVLLGLGVGIQMAPQSFIAAVAAVLIIPVLGCLSLSPALCRNRHPGGLGERVTLLQANLWSVTRSTLCANELRSFRYCSLHWQSCCWWQAVRPRPRRQAAVLQRLRKARQQVRLGAQTRS